VFANGVHRDGSDHQNGLFLVIRWAPAKGMGIGMLFMHHYQVISRSELRRWPFEVISWWERTTQNVASRKARVGSTVDYRLPLDIL